MLHLLDLKARPWVGLIFVALVALLPFIQRPLFVDDHAVFAQAQDLLHHLGTPYATKANLPGWGAGQAIGEDNPPVHFYLLAVFIKLFGPEVWKSHLAMIPIHIAGLLCFYRLARRYVRSPAWATLLWLFSPHFWITANSLLVDGLLAAVLVIGVSAWIEGVEQVSPAWTVIGSMALAAAPLIKYTGLLSWAVVAWWMTLEKKWDDKRLRVWLGLPVGLFAVWLLWSHHLYGQNHFVAVAQSRMTIPHFSDLMTLGAFAAATTPCLLLPLLLTLSGRMRGSIWLTAGLALMSTVAAFLVYRRMMFVAPMALWISAFAAWLLAVAESSREPSKDWLFLAGWASAGLLGLAFALPWVCGRFLVIMGPALIILTVRCLEQKTSLMERSDFRYGALIVLGIFGALLAGADYAQAWVDPQVAQDAEASVTQMHRSPRHCYFPAAALGGLSYYLPPQHWQPIGPGATLQKRDVILVPTRTLPRAFLPQCTDIMRLTDFTYTSIIPFRTLDSISGAGFYGSVWGPLPFSISTQPLETYILAACNDPPVIGTGRAQTARADGRK